MTTKTILLVAIIIIIAAAAIMWVVRSDTKSEMSDVVIPAATPVTQSGASTMMQTPPSNPAPTPIPMNPVITPAPAPTFPTTGFNPNQ